METQEYDKMAEVEDRMWFYRAQHRQVERQLERWLGPGGKTILDAGCGTGGMMKYLAGRHPEWDLRGVDISAKACGYAARRTGLPVAEASILDLPLEDEAVDGLYSIDVVCQVEDDARALRECRRVLRAGGVAVIQVPAYRWLWSYHDVAVQSVRRYGRQELTERMGKAGLEVVFVTHWNGLTLPFTILKRKVLGGRPGESDVRVFPAILEAFFGGLMGLEQAWVERGGVIPAGSSLLAVGRKAGGKQAP